MDQLQLAIHTAIKAWELQISRADRFFNSVDDASLTNEIVPGKNRISYLLGHLIAVNDNIHAMFGMSERSYEHLDKPFVTNADRATEPDPDISTLREDWKRSNEQLAALFARMTPADWLSRHTAMSDEDFMKDPSRNKLAVLMNRTSHVAYHLGQLLLWKPRWWVDYDSFVSVGSAGKKMWDLDPPLAEEIVKYITAGIGNNLSRDGQPDSVLHSLERQTETMFLPGVNALVAIYPVIVAFDPAKANNKQLHLLNEKGIQQLIVYPIGKIYR